MITQLPSGLIVACLLLGAVNAFILYFRDLRRGSGRLLIYAMTTFRFLSVSLIAFLLLSPMIRRTVKQLEKPVIVIGVDDSRSLVMTADSSADRNNLPVKIRELAGELGKKCDVRIYSFGDKLSQGLSGTFSGSATDISLFFNEVNTRYAHRNAAAVILASDGIYNKGSDPFYAARNLPFPVYTIALGDTSLKKDISIRKVNVNRVAYLGDKFPVEVLVDINRYSGQDVRISLSKGSRLIDSRILRAGSDRSMQKITFLLDAAEKGLARYILHIDEKEGEANLDNNTAGFLVEVLEARQKIALVSAAPHPDITAIAKALEGSTHFELEIVQPGVLPSDYNGYDLVILHQIPSVTSVSRLDPLMKSGIPLLFILGAQSDLNTFNNLRSGLAITGSKAGFSESQAMLNRAFSLFTMDTRDQELFGDLPPLYSPFGLYQTSPMAEVLFYQQIGNITTKSPLVLFNRTDQRKTGVIAGENIWRWRIAEFAKNSNHERFDRWIDRVVQYLSTKEDKSFFRIRHSVTIPENEPVEFEAELYNASYELVNQPDVNITITDREGKSYPFIFSKTAKAYFLNAGIFPVGEYSYLAKAQLGNNRYEKAGKFFIEQINLESANLIADHALLFRLASVHDGEMVSLAETGSLAEKILSRPDIRSVAIYQKKLTDLVGNPWLFALILALLTAEWILRKREGM